MNNLSKNISSIAAVRTQRFVVDFIEIHTLLSFAIAFCAGYFFQSKFVFALTNDMTAARIVAAFTCVGLTALAKYFMRCLDDNEKLGPWIHAWIKPAFGLAAVIFIFWVDSKTSNMAIENSRADDLAAQLTQSTNSIGSHISELKRSKKYQEDQVEYFKKLEAETGKRYIKKRENALAEIARLDQLISKAESSRQETIGKANDLRIATVKDIKTDSLKNVKYGTYVLLVAIAIEVLAVGRRKPSPIYEVELENLKPLIEATQPVALLPAQATPSQMMAKVVERKETIAFSKTHTIQETETEIPITPATPNEAIDLYAQGKIGAKNGWSQRRIAKNYFGGLGHLSEVNALIKNRQVELAKYEEV